MHNWHRTRLAALALAAGVAFGLAQAQGAGGTATQVSKLYENALARYEQKDFSGAVIQLKNALQLDKRNLTVQLLLGKVLVESGQVGAAEVALTEALNLGVNRAEVVVLLARALIEQGKQRDLANNPVFITAGLPPQVQFALHLMMAGAAGDTGDTRGALQAIAAARALDPNSAASWMSEVPVRIRARQFREAQAAAEQALSRDPKSAEPLYIRGTVAHVQNDITGALGWYDKALALDPKHVESLVARAGLYYDLKRDAEAKRDIAALAAVVADEPRGVYLGALIAEREGDFKASKAGLTAVAALLDPVPLDYLRYRPQLLMLAGLSHYGLRQFEKAVPYLEMVVRLQPGSPVSKVLGQIYLSQNNAERAVSSLETYLRAFPQDAQAISLLASTHMAQGRYGRAAQLTQDALKQSDSAQLHTTLGLSMLGGGKTQSAIGELEAALKRDPANVQAGTALINLYLLGREPRKAVALAEALAKRLPKHPGVLYELGRSHAASGQGDRARKAFEAALAIAPKFQAPRIELARLDMLAQQYPAAIAKLDQVLLADARQVPAMLLLGELAERRGQLPEAQRWLERADDSSGPETVHAALALVDFHLRHRQVELAREASKRFASKPPDHVHIQLAQARVSLAAGDAAAARSTLTRASSLAGDDAAMLLQVALLQLEAGHLPGAAHSLGKALAQKPDLSQAQAVMAEVELQQGDTAKAEERARQLVARHPKLGVGHGLLGDAAMARGQVKAGVDHYRRAHEVEPSSSSLLRWTAALLLPGGGSAGQAQQAVEQWLKQHPRDLAVRHRLAEQLARNGQLDAARRAYQALVEQAPKDADALNNYANVLLLLNDKQALSIAERALAQRPDAPHIIGTAGWAAFKAGQTDRALQLLRDARLRDPANRDTRYFLGAVLAAVGRQAEARVELEAAVAPSDAPFGSHAAAKSLLATLR